MPSFNGRTYGKSSTKRKHSFQPDLHPRKRRRPAVETEETDKDEASTETEDDSLPVPQQHGHIVSNDSHPSPPPRIVRDLSGIFHQFSPVPSHTTPTKLASRMLRRSKTDSSIDANEASHVNRTPSLPNMPSPQPPASAIHDTRPLTVSKPNNNRTYAGQSRSFLVSIPISSLDPLSPEQHEDEYSTRESYASLRSRWGVDNSEDDPYPDHVSPTRSNSLRTPSGTPSKSGRGRSKTQEALLRAQASLPDGMMNPLKSITELRSKGESRRFLDEVGYLLEGMDPSVSLSLRKVSALEITTKLCNADFFRKAKAADFFNKAWDIFLIAGAGRGDDKLLDIVLAFFAALVSREPGCLADIAQRSTGLQGAEPAEATQTPSFNPSFVDTLFSLLDMPVDPLLVLQKSFQEANKNDIGMMKSGISKKDRALFQTILDAIAAKSSLFPPDTLLSTSLLVLRTLRTLPPSLIPLKHFPTLITSLHNTLPPFLQPTSTSSHISWPDSASSVPFENIYCHLRLIDSYLLGQWRVASSHKSDNAEVEWNENEAILTKARETWLSDELVALGVCAELANGASAKKCMEVAFRVLVSLTHADEAWGLKVVDSDYSISFILRIIVASSGGLKFAVEGRTPKSSEEVNRPVKGTIKQEVLDVDRLDEAKATTVDEDESVHAIDMLCLALGLLTNLVQVVDTMKDILRETRINPSCKLRKRSCIRQCVCGGDVVSALEIFLQIYKSCTSHSFSEIRIKSEQDPSLGSEVNSADALFLRGHLAVLFGLLIRGSPKNKTYILGQLGGARAPARLAEHAREFSTFYTALSDGNEVGQDSTVTRDVVAFLEELKL